MQSPWEWFRYLETEPAARSCLTDAYSKRGIERPDRAAFQQSSRFMYAWKQARAFYDSARESPLLIRPLLLFYGAVCLLKGAVIARDPDYPPNSRVLQHGVTTRKIKRTPYRLLEDDVRLQKEGFCTHAAQVLGAQLWDRYQIRELVEFIPELADVAVLFGCSPAWQAVRWDPDTQVVTFLQTPTGSLAFSDDTLLVYLNRTAPASPFFEPAIPPAPNGSSSGRCFRLVSPCRPLTDHPLFAQNDAQGHVFWTGQSEPLPPPAWCVHYLLLYQLSMLCRYDQEWWGELICSQSMAEVYLVERFLDVHMEVFPRLVLPLLPSMQNTRR